MTGRQSSATDLALQMMERGVGLRAAAAAAGISASTLVRARKRAGLPALQRGRRPK